MGFSQGSNTGTSEHSNTTIYQGQNAFDPIMKQLAGQYGKQQSLADLLMGGEMYGAASNYLDPETAAMTPAERRSVLDARAEGRNRVQDVKRYGVNEKGEVMDGEDGRPLQVWAFDPAKGIYIGREQTTTMRTIKDAKGNEREVETKSWQPIGSWSPYDTRHKDPSTGQWSQPFDGDPAWYDPSKKNAAYQWKQSYATGSLATGKGNGTGDILGGGGSGGGEIPPVVAPGGTGSDAGPGSGGTGGSSVVPGGGDIGHPGATTRVGTNPQTGMPWGSKARNRAVPTVGREDEQGLTGLGVRTESPATGGGDDQAADTQGDMWSEPGSGELASGQRGRTVDSGRRPVYDQEPGKSAGQVDLASQHPATFQRAMERIGESGGEYYKDPNAFREPFDGEGLRQTRKPEEEAAEQTFSQLLSGLRGR